MEPYLEEIATPGFFCWALGAICSPGEKDAEEAGAVGFLAFATFGGDTRGGDGEDEVEEEGSAPKVLAAICLSSAVMSVLSSLTRFGRTRITKER